MDAVVVATDDDRIAEIVAGFGGQVRLTSASHHSGTDRLAEMAGYLECDVLVPAALERVITGENAARLRCRILAEGANGPTTPEADAVLDARRDEIFVIPDILANSGLPIIAASDLGDAARKIDEETDHELGDRGDEPGARLRQPALAVTLRRIAAAGGGWLLRGSGGGSAGGADAAAGCLDRRLRPARLPGGPGGAAGDSVSNQ